MPTKNASRPKKYFSRYKTPLTDIPHLVEAQLVSFSQLMDSGFENLLKEFSPITDYAGKKLKPILKISKIKKWKLFWLIVQIFWHVTIKFV
jgi:DNA-directed RNA polymerase beta subunit